jgi:hypothetical protein
MLKMRKILICGCSSLIFNEVATESNVDRAANFKDPNQQEFIKKGFM